MCYVHNQCYDISCAILYIVINHISEANFCRFQKKKVCRFLNHLALLLSRVDRQCTRLNK